MRAERNRQAGFTLVEVVVAFAIFALSLGAIYEAFTASKRRAAQGRDQALALLEAQSLVSELRARAAPWEATQTGRTTRGSNYRLNVTPLDTPTDDRIPWRAFDVKVYIEPAGTTASAVELESIELARSAP